MRNPVVIGLNALFRSHFRNTAEGISCRKKITLRLDRWGIAFGGVLGALLVSANAYAAPFYAAETVSESAFSPVIGQPFENGIYYYGSAPEPDKIGAAYIVFQVLDSQLVGAIFMPQSSFDCFTGQATVDELALQITNSYDQETYTYPIALVSSGDAIAAGGASEIPMTLEGFFNLGRPGDAEQSLLSTCQESLLPKASMEL